MPSIRCLLGSVSSGLDIPDLPLVLNGIGADAYFAEASGNDIRMTVDESLLHNATQPSLRAVESLDLHRALRKITNNPLASTKVRRIGLVFAGRYKPKPAVLGLMFDWGKKFAFDQHDTSEFHGVAREGCAVFLDRIREIRPGDEEYRKQVAFTAIHELGHVFNLQHKERPTPLSFMANSQLARAYESHEGAFQFLDADRQLLRQCSLSPHIWPGGSEFRDLGPLAAVDVAIGKTPQSVGLKLEVDVFPREFWPFEPVELDVMLQTSRGSRSTFRVPDTIDPGYEHFSIWIECPNGELRKFRSPRHYCWNGSRVSISSQKPFCRDISIFVEAGGYTFNQAGPHKVYATFQAGKKWFLVSNKVEINILPACPDDSDYIHMHKVLTKQSHAKLLYYRRASRTHSEMSGLERFSKAFRGTTAALAVNYALGRANMKAAETVRDSKRARKLIARATKHLGVAANSVMLSPHRRRLAEHLVSHPLA